jgi:tetratricopeptide (TPR) repeat protein
MPVASLLASPAGEADLSLGKIETPQVSSTLSKTSAHHAEAMAHYAAALQFEQSGKLRQALEHYLAVFEADPSNADLANKTASLAMQFRGRDEAFHILEKAVAANPGSPHPLLNLARFAATYPGEDPAQLDPRAMQAVQSALQRFPRHAEVYEAAVMLHLTQGQRTQAIALMEGAAKLEVTDPRFWLQMGSVAERVWPLGQMELRQEHLSRVSPWFEAALKRVSPINEEQITLEVAQHYLLVNELARSQQLCEQLESKHGSLAARKILVRMHEAHGEKDKALATLEKVVAQAPDDIEHQRLLAREYDRRELHEKAIPHLQAAIQLGGGEVADYLSLGWMLWQARQVEPMVRLGERAVKLFPEQPLAHYQLAIGHRAREQHAASAARFEEAERLATASQPEILDHTFYYQYGITLENLARYEDASRALEKSISITPREKAETAANTMNFLGFMWLEQNQKLEKAGELIAKANELSPDNPAYVDSLGWYHFKRGDYPKALAELRRAEKLLAKIEPEDAEILEHIGLTHFQLGQAQEGLDYLRRADALQTPFKPIRERIQRKLQQLTTPAETQTK